MEEAETRDALLDQMGKDVLLLIWQKQNGRFHLLLSTTKEPSSSLALSMAKVGACDNKLYISVNSPGDFNEW